MSHFLHSLPGSSVWQAEMLKTLRPCSYSLILGTSVRNVKLSIYEELQISACEFRILEARKPGARSQNPGENKSRFTLSELPPL